MAGKYRRKGSKTSLFLIELIISVFFFSLAGVVCVRLFLYAASVSRDASELSHAVLIAQNAAESFLCAQGNPEEASLLFLDSMNAPAELVSAYEKDSGAGTAAETLLLSFDEKWTLTDAGADTAPDDTCSYYVLLDYSGKDAGGSPSDHMSRLRIEAGRTSPSSILYELPVAYYTGLQGSAQQTGESAEDGQEQETGDKQE